MSGAQDTKPMKKSPLDAGFVDSLGLARASNWWDEEDHINSYKLRHSSFYVLDHCEIPPLIPPNERY